MPDLRTPKAVGDLVESVQGDLDNLVSLIGQAKDLAEALISPTKGLNGLSGFLRGQVTLLGEMTANVQTEVENVRKNMLDDSPLPKVETIVEDGQRVAERVKA